MQTFRDPATRRVVVAQDLERFHVFGIAAHHAFEKPDFDIQVAPLSAAKWFWRRRSLLRHTTDANQDDLARFVKALLSTKFD